MIKFFRKIRYDLMEKNKTGKYFKYAIGEIILVVIGILIALQINNWNEQRKDNKRAKDYITRISEDLERSLELSEKLLEQNKSILLAVTETQKLIERGTELTTSEKKTIDYSILWFPRTTYQLPDMLTYEEMKESGDLGLIKDIDLRNDLAEFYSYTRQVKTVYEKLSRNIENQHEVFNTEIRTYTNPETLDLTFSYDIKSMSQNTIFINTFSRMATHWRGYVYFMERVHRQSKDLLKKVNNYD
ncbi:DUF6090 family protein [Winogradskyella ouciana]|uniref:DUF6090 family protein n=1 Tax=Winogradskyella ouciana TaxID=2608631 RepID=UPI003D297918